MNLYDTNDLARALIFCYRVMVASAPLLEFAIPRSDGRLRAYYAHHLEEERGHDEMVLADLKALGLTTIPRSHVAAQLAGSQYYLIANEHPALLLGYMLALEKESMTPAQVDALGAHHGFTLTAFRHHCEHDPVHKDDLLREIEALDADLRTLVMWNEGSVSLFLERALK